MNSFPVDWFRKLRSGFLVVVTLIALVDSAAQSGPNNYFFSHLAGPLGGPGRADGSGPAARFYLPDGVASDGQGNVYVVDSGNHTIRKITASGVTTTFAGMAGVAGSADGTGPAARFSDPHGIALDNIGNIYVADSGNATIRKITAGGGVTTLAGLPGVQGSTDGTGANGLFWYPRALVVDGAGTIYVADNSTIRKIAAGGVVTTPAGQPGPWGNADGTGPTAQFAYPSGITVDGAGTVYVADTGNNKIRKLTPGGVVTTINLINGTGGAVQLYGPYGITVDSAANLYVTENSENTVRKITPGGVVTTLAGSYSNRGGSEDGVGIAAQFSNPRGVALDNAGNFFVADSSNHTLRKINSGVAVTTLAGLAGGSGSTDGTGVAARFNFAVGAAVDGEGNVYVADTINQTIRKITPGGAVTTLAGGVGVYGGVDGTGADARFFEPNGVATDRAGNVYVADTWNHAIRQVTPAGVVTTFAGTLGFFNMGSTDGTGAAARFRFPNGVAVDDAGNVYVSDSLNSTIRKITPGGVVTTLAGTAGVLGSLDGQGTAALFWSPRAIASDAAGTVYVADNYVIRKITAGGVVTTLAGTPGVQGNVDGTGAAARFTSPSSLGVDGAGNVFVTELINFGQSKGGNTIRKITPGGVVTTVAGSVGFIGSEDGVGLAAGFNSPSGIAVDGSGVLYIVEAENNAVRKGQPAGPPVITAQPQSQTAAPGGNAQFSVTASGVPAPTYQWYFNGSPFSGATTNTLSFTNARSSDAGDYTVVVTNALGGVTSNKATLTISSATVTPPPAAGSESGGGSMAGGFVLALIVLGSARSILRQNRGDAL